MRATFAANARFAEPALVDDAVGIVVAPAGRLALVLRFGIVGDKIAEIDIEADPDGCAASVWPFCTDLRP